MEPVSIQLQRVLRCTCDNDKTLVDCDHRYQQAFDLKEACRHCYPELYEREQ